ncbi:MAG: hypothetical protein J6X78_12130 [Treponema sp.]|nr:hypothetical protein [Treponema sp.]
MMKMNHFIKRFSFIFTAFIAVMIFTGCKLQTTTIPRFTISELCIRKGFDEDACVLGGIYFDFFNKSQKQIISMDLNVRIFDANTGEPALAGVTTISSSYEGLIESLEKREMCISLDDYITFDFDGNLIIDAFIISKIVYSDGEIWCDYFGLYGNYART